MHARVAADALARLVTDVRTGRAQWQHPQAVRQTTADLVRLADALAVAVQHMTAALGQSPVTTRRPQTDRAVQALLHAGQASATAAQHLRQADRAMH
ncbi:hypothetical protein [Streptomyces mexicanus]|uniref:hypothetical protein n=1 Tax=Streptomyces mexicanus TaxID=178566 RepID=UPI0031E77E6C